MSRNSRIRNEFGVSLWRAALTLLLGLSMVYITEFLTLGATLIQSLGVQGFCGNFRPSRFPFSLCNYACRRYSAMRSKANEWIFSRMMVCALV